MSSFVYWIKHKDHANILEEGYVGITSTSVKNRFTTHKRIAKKLEFGISQDDSQVSVVHRAMVKYGEDIEIVTVCECDDEYSYWLENKLRPEPLIGWNVNVGGQYNGRLGRPQTDKQRLVVSEMNRGKHIDTSYLVDILKVREIPSDELARSSEVILNQDLISSPYTNKDVISLCNEIYDLYNMGYRVWRINKALNLDKSTGYTSLFRRFKEGYNPREDSVMQDFIYHYLVQYGRYDKTKPKRYQERRLPKNIHKNKKGHYVAHVEIDGKRKSKTFNIYTHGEDASLKMAQDWLVSVRADNAS